MTDKAENLDVDELEFTESKGLGAWLAKRDRGACVVIAARAALRALPMVAADLHHVDGESFFRSQIVLPVFRALAATWLHARYPEETDGLSALAAADAAEAVEDAAEAAVANETASAASFAAEAADLATSVGNCASDAVAAVAAASAIYDGEFSRVFWEAISADATQIEQGDSIPEVAASPLWPEGQPLRGVWRGLRNRLLAAKEDWQVWTDWYEDRLIGCTKDREHELCYARLPEKLWNRGPGTVNGWIRQELAKPQDEMAS